MKDKISITQLGDVLVLRKVPTESRVFLSTGDSIIISKTMFISVLNGLVRKGIISPKVLEGILEEYNTE